MMCGAFSDSANPYHPSPHLRNSDDTGSRRLQHTEGVIDRLFCLSDDAKERPGGVEARDDRFQQVVLNIRLMASPSAPERSHAMSTLTARRLATALTFTIALALCSMVLPLQAMPARAEVVGNTYTSPLYGYSLTWDESWIVTDDTSTEVDSLDLTNGIGYVNILGGDGFTGSALMAIFFTTTKMRSSSHISNFQELPAGDGIPGSGGDANRYFTTVSYTYTDDDGSTRDFTDYYEARTIIPGQAIIVFDGLAPTEVFPLAMPTFQPLLDSMV